MKPNSATPLGTSGLFPALPPSLAAARPGFYFKPGTARVDLPPIWCNVPQVAQLLGVKPSEERRALDAGQGTVVQGAAGASTSASTAMAAPDTNISVVDAFRVLCAAQPGVFPYVGVVPHPLRMGRTPYVDLNGVARAPIGNISETQTVWDTNLVLSDAQARALPRGGDFSSLQYFDGYTLDLAGTSNQGQAVLALQKSDKEALARFLSILDGSPTFRTLVQQAADRGNLPLSGAPGRWVVSLRSPHMDRDGMAFYPSLGVDRKSRSISLPLRDPRPVGNEFYLFKAGFLMPMTPMCHSVRAMVAALTDANRLDITAWLGADGLVRPERIAALGAGERGAVDALSQRILTELGLPFYRWVSPLPFMEGIDVTSPRDASPIWRPTEAVRQAFEAIGGIEAVEEYVKWQDDYLQGQFPIN